MSKKVWVEAELIDEEDCQVKIGGSYAYTTSRHIHDIPESVELPEILIRVIENWKGASLETVLVEEYFNESSAEIDSDEVHCAIYNHFDDFCFAFVTGNYKVKKEPKWIVKLGEMYFIKGTSNLVFTFDKNEARKYHSKTDAEYVMSLFDGTVEEVESE